MKSSTNFQEMKIKFHISSSPVHKSIPGPPRGTRSSPTSFANATTLSINLTTCLPCNQHESRIPQRVVQRSQPPQPQGLGPTSPTRQRETMARSMQPYTTHVPDGRDSTNSPMADLGVLTKTLWRHQRHRTPRNCVESMRSHH